MGAPFSFKATVTTVKERPPRTGKLNQSVRPTWLSRPLHIPLAAMLRGVASVPMASFDPPTAELATFTVSVCVLPAAIEGTGIAASVPEGAGEPSR